MCPIISFLCLKNEVPITFFKTHYIAVLIKKCSESTSVIKIVAMKFWTISITERKPSCATTKLILFIVSKGEDNTKKDTGKSMKNALYILQYSKRHLKQCLTIKPTALEVLELCLSVVHLNTHNIFAHCLDVHMNNIMLWS